MQYAVRPFSCLLCLCLANQITGASQTGSLEELGIDQHGGFRRQRKPG